MPHRGSELCGWLDAVLGSVLLSSAFWLQAIENASMFLHFLVLLCGAIIGIHGVWRIFHGRAPKEASYGEEE